MVLGTLDALLALPSIAATIWDGAILAAEGIQGPGVGDSGYRVGISATSFQIPEATGPKMNQRTELGTLR